MTTTHRCLAVWSVGSILMLFAMLCTGCTCPSGKNVSLSFQHEEENVVQAALSKGYHFDQAEMSNTPVILVDEPDDICDGAKGCHCVQPMCSVVVLPAKPVSLPGNVAVTPAQIALHEYVHVGFDTIGQDTTNHPQKFWDVYNAALKLEEN